MIWTAFKSRFTNINFDLNLKYEQSIYIHHMCTLPVTKFMSQRPDSKASPIQTGNHSGWYPFHQQRGFEMQHNFMLSPLTQMPDSLEALQDHVSPSEVE